jgi:hypothetical protein
MVGLDNTTLLGTYTNIVLTKHNKKCKSENVVFDRSQRLVVMYYCMCVTKSRQAPNLAPKLPANFEREHHFRTQLLGTSKLAANTRNRNKLAMTDVTINREITEYIE